ncbi:hypothetical protein FRC16_001484 [Serendipita sp. 398]|nr:hypothetical protein FRC16_001484 [Serendipita sp. 398]
MLAMMVQFNVDKREAGDLPFSTSPPSKGMKLDATDIRYLSSEEFRVLTAVEMGSKNHEVVPTSLISQISKLRSGGINKILGGLAKRGLVSRVQNAKCQSVFDNTQRHRLSSLLREREKGLACG